MFLHVQFQHLVYVSRTQVNSSFNSPSSHPPWYSQSFPAHVDFDTLSEKELTVVTGYFDVGLFQKGAGGPTISPQIYRKWMTVFAQIRNPVVAYFDSYSHATLMRVIRKQHPKTRIIIVDRNTLWSFRENEPRIAKIFSRHRYPWNPPNTVLSNYSAAMHAKYELMRRTIRDNPFQSAYICWLDLGLFRDLASGTIAAALTNDKSFRLALPPRLNTSAVAYTLVYPASVYGPVSAEQIVKQNTVWVCGCFFIGRVDVVWNWTTEYLMAVEQMVLERWMSTDQQVIYWLFHGEGKAKVQPNTTIQLYQLPVGDDGNSWFYLAYLAKKAGEER